VFVSDSGNHRIVVLEKDGRFVTSVGSPVGESGFADGDFDSARFTSPQGLAVLDGVRRRLSKRSYQRADLSTV
jgi:DNA-binding beta-propeller fold protein YncE